MASRLRRAYLVLAAIAVALERGEAQTISIIDDAKLPRFEVASVKPGDPNSTWGSFGAPPGRFNQENTPLLNALIMAFNIRPYQLTSPLPDLITREPFTITRQRPERRSLIGR